MHVSYGEVTTKDLNYDRQIKPYLYEVCSPVRYRVIDNYLHAVYEKREVIESLRARILRTKQPSYSKFKRLIPLWKQHIALLKSVNGK